MSNKYKNVSDSIQSLMGYGKFQPGEEFETEDVIENPNFRNVNEVTQIPVQEVLEEQPAEPQVADPQEGVQ